jgi:MFS family permease
MEAAALPLGVVIGIAVIGILVDLIGYKGILIIVGVIVLIGVGFWITAAVSLKNTVNMVRNRNNNPTAPPPTGPQFTGPQFTGAQFTGAQELNGGKKHAKKRK